MCRTWQPPILSPPSPPSLLTASGCRGDPMRSSGALVGFGSLQDLTKCCPLALARVPWVSILPLSVQGRGLALGAAPSQPGLGFLSSVAKSSLVHLLSALPGCQPTPHVPLAALGDARRGFLAAPPGIVCVHDPACAWHPHTRPHVESASLGWAVVPCWWSRRQPWSLCR